MERTYENALEIINSRRRQSRPIEAAKKKDYVKNVPLTNGTPDLKGTPSITGMREWLKILGYANHDVDRLNVIHVAGTKGKGSTCAFTESFLRAHGRSAGYPRKTGMYTSPHLIFPEERIRINSQPLDRALFAKYFFELYDKLPQLAVPYDPTKDVLERGPRYLQLFALLAFHVFIREEVDVTILETHNGGEYDATNVVEGPVVTVITTLGMDHIDMLGPTIENIAWHKSGIYKSGAIALSTSQDPAPARVVTARAKDVGAEVAFIDVDHRLPVDSVLLQPFVQRKNASLALAAAEAFLKAKQSFALGALTKDDIALGVQQWIWPGRFQLVNVHRHTWFLDAAHNEMSVTIAAEWFAEVSVRLKDSATRILVFSHINELRDNESILRCLATALQATGIDIPHVVFTTYDTKLQNDNAASALALQSFHAVWREVFSKTTIWDEPSIPGAMRFVGQLSQDNADAVHVLVTGSQHLVGPVLQILQGG